MEERRTRAEEGIELLIRRAKDAGALRSDFERADLTLAFMAIDGARASVPDHAAQAAARRLVAHLLRSFRAGSRASPALPPRRRSGCTSTSGSDLYAKPLSQEGTATAGPPGDAPLQRCRLGPGEDLLAGVGDE